jgi:hypothetical protein
MTMCEERHIDVNQALFGERDLVRAAMMAVLGGILVLAEIGCGSDSILGNGGGAVQGGTPAGGSRASSGPAATASGGHVGASSTGLAETGGSLSSGGKIASGGSTSVPTGGVGPSGGGGAAQASTVTVAGGASGGAGALGGSATGGSAIAGSTGTVPGGPDAGADVAMTPDSNRSGDAPADGSTESNPDADAGEEGDGDITLSCDEILFDNSGPPQIYPVIYQPTVITPDPLAAEKAQLLSTPLAGSPFNQYNTVPAVEAFLSGWEELYGYEGIQTTAGSAFCFNQICSVDFTQNYCGLSLHSPKQTYNGSWRVIIYSPEGTVESVSSDLVHMVPIPRNVLVTQKQVISAIAGRTFTYECATYSPSVTISDQDTFVIPGPSVYVQASPTVASAVEYRLAIPVKVTSEGTSWTVYVDGIDATFLEAEANFICD